jgi:hypothetical protein
MIKINKLFVSMMPVKHGGAGDYLVEVLKNYDEYIKFIVPNFFIKIWILNRACVIFFQHFYKFYLKLFLKLFSVNKLVVFHQQSISYNLTTLLILNSKDIEFYILDANFFCKKSYNEYGNKSCFKCFEKFDPYDDCIHHPYVAKDLDYIKFVNTLRTQEKKITFLVQTEGYRRILISKFPLAKVKKLKMKHDRLVYDNIESFDNKNLNYDFFFHAHLTRPKGIEYFIRLAKKMHYEKFFLPSHKNFIGLSLNIIIKNISWGKTFVEEIKKTKIVLCPSIWTYPVESALIKSMLLKKAVAIIDIKNSFSEEIPDDCVIKLTGDTNNDSVTLKFFLNEKRYLKIANNGFNWATSYLK